MKGEPFVAELISYVYDRPHMYCRTLGELDILLHYLHYVWARMSGTLESYERHRVEYHLSLGFEACSGPVTDENRVTFLESAPKEIVENTIGYWKTLDDRIGLVPKDPHDPPKS